jgi:hypothetical protein
VCALCCHAQARPSDCSNSHRRPGHEPAAGCGWPVQWSGVRRRTPHGKDPLCACVVDGAALASAPTGAISIRFCICERSLATCMTRNRLRAARVPLLTCAGPHPRAFQGRAVVDLHNPRGCLPAANLDAVGHAVPDSLSTAVGNTCLRSDFERVHCTQQLCLSCLSCL